MTDSCNHRNKINGKYEIKRIFANFLTQHGVVSGWEKEQDGRISLCPRSSRARIMPGSQMLLCLQNNMFMNISFRTKRKIFS